MYLLVIGLGVLLQSQGIADVLQRTRTALGAYLDPFDDWKWFIQASWPLQLILYLLPIGLLYFCFGWLFSAVNSGFSGVALWLVGFLISVSGYARLALLDKLTTLLEAQQWDQAKRLMQAQCGIAPERYHQRFMALAFMAVFKTIFIEWFAALFWFLLLGPFAALLITLLSLLTLTPTLPQTLRHKVKTLLEGICWIPLRLFILPFIWVMTARYTRPSRMQAANLPAGESVKALYAQFGHIGFSIETGLQLVLCQVFNPAAITALSVSTQSQPARQAKVPTSSVSWLGEPLAAHHFKILRQGITKTFWVWYGVIGLLSLFL